MVNEMNRRKFVQFVGGGIMLAQLVPFLSCRKTRKPNVILIQMDDLGWSDLGIHGNTIVNTPNIDKLGHESVRLNQFYVNPVCAPSRAALLTGRDFLRTGVSHVHGGKDFLHLQEKTIADAFKAGGYKTGMWGKWHSGHTDGYYPWERGFDTAYMAQLYKHRESDGRLNGEYRPHDAWADEVLINSAIEFIRTSKGQLFFGYISSLTCHSPLDAPDQYVQKYKAKNLSDALSVLYAMIEFFDVQLGRLMAFLQDSGLEENTIVLFISDNGPAVNNAVFTDADREIRYVNGLKGHKGNIWENGVKSPLFIRWKGHYQPKVSQHLCDITDLYPTLMDIAGLSVLDSGFPVDGLSFKKVLAGNSPAVHEEKISFNYANPGWPPTDKPWTPEGVKDEYHPYKRDQLYYEDKIISIRKGPYKLLFNPGKVKDQAALIGGYALFHIHKDPLENYNLINEKPAIAGTLKEDLKHWFSGLKAEDHAFEMPVFFIGHEGKESSTVWAKGPKEISPGLKNAFNYLGGWQKAGDYAIYQLCVKTSGKYHVVLHHDSDIASGATLKIAIADQENNVMILNNQTVGCGNFDLPEGNMRLKVEVVHIPGSNKVSVIDRLVSFTFKKQ